jgi:hypothetical protein
MKCSFVKVIEDSVSRHFAAQVPTMEQGRAIVLCQPALWGASDPCNERGARLRRKLAPVLMPSFRIAPDTGTANIASRRFIFLSQATRLARKGKDEWQLRLFRDPPMSKLLVDRQRFDYHELHSQGQHSSHFVDREVR